MLHVPYSRGGRGDRAEGLGGPPCGYVSIFGPMAGQL